MQKIGILVDTTCDLDLRVQENSSIKIIPLQIIFNDGRTFRDKYEISYDEVVESLDEFETKTSLPTMQEAVDAMDDFVKNGYTHVITLCLSHELSGTFGMVKNVSDLYKDKLVIENIETRTVTWGVGHIALELQKMMEQGKSFEELVIYLKEKIKKRNVFFAVETLKYLIRGGRISKISGTIGEALDIKPILTLDAEGKLISVDKVRGRKKSLNRLAELLIEASRNETIEKIYVLHGAREEDADLLRSKLQTLTDAPIEVEHLGPLVSVHVGPGLVGAYAIYA